MKIHIGILAFILWLISACTVEVAKPEQKPNLVIASDFLSQKDLYKLDKFRESYSGKISIRKLGCREIQKKIASEGLNTSIDCILVSSEFYAAQLAYKQKMFVFKKKPYNYQRLLQNRLVILSKKDSSYSIVTTLNKLGRNEFDCTIEKDVLNRILLQLTKDTYRKKLISELTGNNYFFTTKLSGERPCLTTHIEFNRSKFRRKYFSRSIDFPSDHTCFMIVKHAKHHSDAMDLLKFLLENQIKL